MTPPCLKGQSLTTTTHYSGFIILDGLKFLMETASLAKYEMMGYLQEGWKGRLPQVHRPSLSILTDDRLKKWAVPRYMYKHRRFPKFLSGSGYFVEKNDAECLLDMSQVRSVPLINVTDITAHITHRWFPLFIWKMFT